MWEKLKKSIIKIHVIFNDHKFLEILHFFENVISKLLSIFLIVVIFFSLIDLTRYLYDAIASYLSGTFGATLTAIFGLFLNILIAMELLENISGYLKKNVVQVELVIVTSIIAVARKIIIFDFGKYGSTELATLVIATLGLSGSYWILKKNNPSCK
ncbi:MAG: phosphate-starvation-inducible PsiE family protein [Snowella sp.]|nr:phosphate-starvation-inducible PsiE family protein [Snowella sp.]